ncbi:MAG TPA: terminase family protein [Stellaceae bacterium]|nr:terminase family protein [Stellaceae bacterium]
MDDATRSLAERIAASPAGIDAARRLSEAQARRVIEDWASWARPTQLAPAGAWRVWLMLAGRGFGKTRSGAEWVRARVEMNLARRVALVAPTAADARNVMIEGESGLLAVAPKLFRPLWEPSKRRVTWPNGAIATAFSADEPARLRGPQHDAAWCDELAAWRYDEAWDNLMLGLRLGSDPRCVVTTTPRPVRLVRRLMAAGEDGVALTRGTTWENAKNLAPDFLAAIVKRYERTRLGRQELNAELLEDVPGALWTRALLEREGTRVAGAPDAKRIVVAIDPAATSGEDADETGIIVAQIAWDGHGYVLEDLSGRFAPHAWAARALHAYRRFGADRIIGEANNGGEMVEATVRALDPAASFKAVRASRGKAARAEPIAALYEQGRVHHVGAFPALEDQMCGFSGAAAHGPSPDRLDALVWALSELMLQPGEGSSIFEYYRRLYEKNRKDES